MINCKKCGGPTTPKLIEKGPRGPWTANICTSGCMNDKGYPLHTAPPKVYQPAPQVNPGQVPQQQPANSVAILNEILMHIKAISMAIQLKNDPLEKAHKKAQRDIPTEDTPF